MRSDSEKNRGSSSFVPAGMGKGSFGVGVGGPESGEEDRARDWRYPDA